MSDSLRQPRPLSDPFLRRVVGGAVISGVTAVGGFVAVAVLPSRLSLVVTGVVFLVLAHVLAGFFAWLGYGIGWLAREREIIGAEAGSWMAYPVDEDGIPTSAPVTGRLVLDDPVETRQ